MTIGKTCNFTACVRATEVSSLFFILLIEKKKTKKNRIEEKVAVYLFLLFVSLKYMFMQLF